MSDEVGQSVGSQDTREQAESAGPSSYWLQQIELAEKEHKDWADTAAKSTQRYRTEETRDSKSHFNVLYSNIETWKAALFQQTPKPDIRRRNMDRDPVARFVSELIERALRYVIDEEDLEGQVEATVQEFKLTGRSVLWLRYEPTLETVQETVRNVTINPETGLEEIQAETIEREVVAAQRVWLESTYWKDIVFPAARKYDEVPWIARRHYPTRDELIAQFGDEVGREIPLTWKPEVLKDRPVNEMFQRAELFEIWDKEKRQVVYVARGYNKIVAEDPDPLKLDRFFPIPTPLVDIKTSDTIVPVCEYQQYLPLADELDEIQGRIRKLTKALKRRGVYPAALSDLSKLESAADNEFIPVDTEVFSTILGAGGIDKVLSSEGIQGIANVVLALYQQRDQLKQTIYEVIGISDAMRGTGQASEKATMTKVKASFGSMRMQKKQRDVAKHVRDGLRLVAEVMAEHFELPILIEMTGMAEEFQGLAVQMQADPTADVMALLREDRLRSYRVDIETDSTIAADAEQEKRSFVELMQGTSQFAQSMSNIPQAAQPFFLRMFAEAYRKFKVGRTLEDDLEQVIEQMSQPTPPQPNPEMMKAQQDAQIKAAELQQKGQIAAADLQQRAALKREEAQQNAAVKIFEAQIDAATDLEKEAMRAANVDPLTLAQALEVQQ